MGDNFPMWEFSEGDCPGGNCSGGNCPVQLVVGVSCYFSKFYSYIYL